MDRLVNWVGLHHYSTWMIFAGLVMVAALIHPSLFAVLMIVVIACWQFLTREVARAEGSAGPICIRCIALNGAIMAAALILMLKVNWIAL
jgi:predicted anti-sigma-YlaC factor YlaD